ncbi:hypothetical protein [Paenibacillus donghaensis]|uniref:Uncharacterized protein n=1 Tax=Paenibacillus donghaensis TaxID=414771 RepID=A0A2Z2KAQ4_9BACL|nr:hypothetical protein [Paenibacillus donghaensis]ASA22714.1 hypothetical protein B9T62_19095 [Paenibacillus donghaensis]
MFKKFKLFICLTIFLSILFPMLLISPNNAQAKYVKGYYRSNGTYVNGYYRSDTNSSYTPSNNYYRSDTNSSYTPSYEQSTQRSTSNYTVNLYKGNSYYKTVPSSNLVYIKGYYRTDGTFVRPHFRTHPNDFLTDNFSYLGLSTLKPLQSYSNFQYSDNPKIAVIENYLAYEVYEKSLSIEQLNDLKNYANLIYNENSGNSNILNTLDCGMKYYSSLGISNEIGLELSKFDINGKLTPSAYLSQILYQNNIYSFGEEDFYFFKAYAFSLAGSKDILYGKYYSDRAKEIGKYLYQRVGLSDPTLQIEMDLMQNFEYSGEEFQDIVEDLNQNYLHKYSENPPTDVNYYLDQVLTNNSKTKMTKTEYSQYEASLRILSYNKSLNSYLVKNGNILYNKAGLSTDQTINQISKDIIIFF